jgi:putative addiction module component (TIGR02574 family)
MAILANKIIDQALLLPSEERLKLVEQLIESLNLPTKSEIEHVWAKEAEKRIQEIEQGKVQTLDGELVFQEIREKLIK